MPQLTYTPDDDLKVHEEGAIKSSSARPFNLTKAACQNGLKNSADAYARGNAPEDRRVIVVIFDYSHKGVRPSISCLDFSGMTSTTIEESFRIWADPEASQRGAKSGAVQGGHGNGGKCYMTQMFQDYALIHTAKREQGNRYGVVGGSIRFGYIPNREQGRNFEVEDLGAELEKVLKPVRSSLEKLPNAALKAFREAGGFTFLTGVGPKGLGETISSSAVGLCCSRTPADDSDLRSVQSLRRRERRDVPRRKASTASTNSADAGRRGTPRDSDTSTAKGPNERRKDLHHG